MIRPTALALLILVTFTGPLGAQPTCPCDRTNDGAVDVTDLLDFLTDWFAQNGTAVPPGTGADFDGNGAVFVSDLLEFLACWFPSSGAPPTGPCAEAPWIDGIGTVYGTGQGGNCGWDDPDLDISPFNGRIVAVGADNWDLGLGCGEVYEVRCIGASNAEGTCRTTDPILVMVVDQCPECSNTHLDLSTLAYNDLWDGSNGIIDLQFRKVTGAFPGNVAIDVKAGSSQFFMELYVKFPNRKITGVELRGSATPVFRATEHTPNQGFWRLSPVTPPIQLPIDVRLTADDGTVILGENVITTFSSGNQDFGSNF